MLLADVARRDNRPPSHALLAMWHDALEDIDFYEAKAALKILNRETTDYLMPAHVRQAVKRVRAEVARPSKAAMQAKRTAITTCTLCDDRGYRLPLARRVCTHAELVRIDATAQLRAIRGGES